MRGRTNDAIKRLVRMDRKHYEAHFGGAIRVPVVVVTTAGLLAVDPTPRIVKKAEALFRLMPVEVAEFDHFGASRWLLENPLCSIQIRLQSTQP
jgi:hypothetical protein